MDEFNKACAVVLGLKDYLPTGVVSITGKWRKIFSDLTGYPEVKWLHPASMHFHDSYDWAMLLVFECYERKVFYNSELLSNLGAMPTPHPLLNKPQQISQAALEVLDK